ncbi:hypothetical protein HYN48_11880 [Flavobacterium magnum]|uniref:Tryptophan 2-monooxygenase n=1 Tax=Flavobacterium magnum TaxID=2162713 RepID=A0A2S0RGD9_9FLAO|nr:NAD(P)/FAD-dependent oxidoreductase [Flavobacterium magnum]AWA30726.1 hypothetical protein HYN48_11880 [Flavobacterium magnum]
MKVIIVGAGAAGIMAANILAKKGASVTILEAGNRIGGRIHTFVPDGFVNTVEAGAEFIHGNLPLTLKQLKRAKLPYAEASMTMHRFDGTSITRNFGKSKAWESFYEKLAQLQTDCTLDAFLEAHFRGAKYRLLHREVREMAQGLDLADPSEVSLLSLKAEWLSEETQYRPITGYGPLLEFLYDEATRGDCTVAFGQKATTVRWKSGSASVVTETQSYQADAVILTASLGILKQGEIAFEPEIPELPACFDKIGFGQVIKLALEFDRPFWEQQIPDLAFLFAENGLTFWTQADRHTPVLTGWLGNDDVAVYKGFDDNKIIALCMDELSKIFPEARRYFRTAAVFRYTEDTFFRGGYSWPKPDSKKAVKTINKGFGNTVWFAGEAFDPTFESATVEAALESGKFVAAKVFRALRGKSMRS